MPAPHATVPAFDRGEEPQAKTRVHVLLPLPLTGAYDYAQSPFDPVEPGDFVRVPLGRRSVTGVVWGDGPADPDHAVADAKLKPVGGRLPLPAMPDVTRRFIDWVAAYTCADPGSVLRMAMSVPAALEPPRPVQAYKLDGPPPERMTAARGRVIDVLTDGSALPAAELARAAKVSPGVVQGLAAAGTLIEVALPNRDELPVPDWQRPGRELTETQQTAADELRQRVDGGGFSVTLIDGVTGAGKTEVYFEAIAAALARDRQVLVLVPEIALTAQWLARFEARFGCAPVEWHSDLGAVARRRNWRAVAEGRARVVVGARSALFLPYAELGLIVVDEEHDSAFKQEDGVCYHARDMAVVRGSLAEFPVVLVSATPSLESLTNVQAGRYHLAHLPERVGVAELPAIEAIDMRAVPPPRQHWLSPVLVEAMQEVLAAGEQALLFLNRRGYAPLTLCRTCGHRLECPNCSAWLVEHRFRGHLQCHHCGFTTRPKAECPECGAKDSFAACGPGVERLTEEVAELFPDARVRVVSSDTVHGPAAAAELVQQIAAREIDLIIGTQIVAKGHHFPSLTLVGVVDADLGLSGGDLRAAERTFQLLNQVSGRAGRADRPGRALLQTYMPDHQVMQAMVNGDRDGFLAAEADARRQEGLPPFGRLVALIVSGTDDAMTQSVATALGRKAPRSDAVTVLGPAPAPLSLLRGRYRYRLLLKAPRSVNVSDLARRWVGSVEVPRQVRVSIDVDPYSFF